VAGRQVRRGRWIPRWSALGHDRLPRFSGEAQPAGRAIDRAHLIDQDGAGHREASGSITFHGSGRVFEVIGQTTASFERA
jgi:hypothetical protein